MARRRRSRSSSTFIAVLFVGIIMLYEISSNFTYYLILAGIYIVIALILRKHSLHPCQILNKALKRNLNDQQNLRRLLRKIDAMDGKKFEVFLEGLFKKKGYRVKRTPYNNDFGADLIITNTSGKRTAIQAKRYKSNVGKSAVQEIHAAKFYYKCDSAIVITNSKYTDPATQLAQSCNISLWDREKLIQEIKNLRRNTKLIRLSLQKR